MRALGGPGASRATWPRTRRRPSLAAAIDAMAAVGETCMSAGFCTWCQDACGWYLETVRQRGAARALQPGLASGALMGGTGLSNPMKALLRHRALRSCAAAASPGGYEVSGVLPWVSNLGDGHLFGTVFADADDPAHRVMAMVRCGQPGVEIRQNAHFVALEGTGTYSVLFRRAFIADAQMLADPLGDMVGRIKPGFILLQTGMGLGVIARLHRPDARGRRHPGPHQPLPARARRRLRGRSCTRCAAEIDRLAATPLDGAAEYLRAVLHARLRCSELTLEAGQAALLHWGARGYLRGLRRQPPHPRGPLRRHHHPLHPPPPAGAAAPRAARGGALMPTIRVRSAAGEQVLTGAAGETVMRVVQTTGRPGFGECEGSLACATCHVIVDPAWAERLPPASDDEEAMLDTAFDLQPTSRLGCQITLGPALDGLVVFHPLASQESSMAEKVLVTPAELQAMMGPDVVVIDTRHRTPTRPGTSRVR